MNRARIADSEIDNEGLSCCIDSRGLIELRLPDGNTIVGEYERFTRERLERGGHLEHEGSWWVMRDREDRLGVTVYIFTPAGTDDEDPADRSRARSRRGGHAR